MAKRDPSDVWFVRLPDGRVVRAKSTASVRHHVQSGRIPGDSRVRRWEEEDWTALEWTSEFADLVSQKRKKPEKTGESGERGAELPGPGRESALGARNNGHELHTVGVRGLVEELQAALDSTLDGPKLLIAGLACLSSSLILVLLRLLDIAPGETLLQVLSRLGSGLGMLAIFGTCTVLLTQKTLVELSRLRRARWEEVFSRLGIFTFRLLVLHLLLLGGLVLLIIGLRMLPACLARQDLEGLPGGELLAGMATVLSLLLEVILWPIAGLVLLMGPVVIIEEGSIGKSLRQWWSLVWRHLGRVFLYEALAISLGAIMTIPFLFPVFLAGGHSLAGNPMTQVTLLTLFLLGGCALTPLAAYLVVANVFIYINLRYELSGGTREDREHPTGTRA